MPRTRIHSKPYESESSLLETAGALLDQLTISEKRLNSIKNRIKRDYQKGLQQYEDGDNNSTPATVKMLPTFVQKFQAEAPTKKPKTFLALDLGGTNFRVLVVEIEAMPEDVLKDIEEKDENGLCRSISSSLSNASSNSSLFQPSLHIDSKIYRIPKDKMTGPGDELFDYLANCIGEFIKTVKLKPEDHPSLPIGFTFSFPLNQTNLNAGNLLTWTKGFACDGVVGQDVAEMLNKSISRNPALSKFNVFVAGLCNDTVGTLMSCAFEEPNCRIGLIAGTGSNACYIEKVKNIKRLTASKNANKFAETSDHMIVNCEWGNFGADGIICDVTTDYDKLVDAESTRPGNQIYEKMMGGMYLGEICRHIINRFHQQRLIFLDEDICILQLKDSFSATLISEILGCHQDDLVSIQNIISNRLELGAMRADCILLHQICQAVSTRAAQLNAAGIAAIAEMIVDGDQEMQRIMNDYQNSENAMKLKKQKIVCGVDGTVFRKHPTFSKDLKKFTNGLTPDGIYVEYVLSHDGSGKGAALTVMANQ